MKPQAIVVADDPVYLSWLENAAGNGVEFSLLRALDAEDLLERLQGMGRVDVVFFQIEMSTLDIRVSMIERLAERMPELPLAGLGADSDPNVVLAAMRAGARDFLVLRRDEADVTALLGKLLRRMPAATKLPLKQGQLFTVLSANGCEAIAFVASHLALAMVEALPANERVVLVDVAQPPGAATILLNITQSYSVLDAVNDVYRCDQTLVETAFARHASGLFILSLPEDLVGGATRQLDELAKLLQVLRGLFANVVVSCDGGLPLDTLCAVLGQSDRSVLLADQSIIHSRHSKFLLRALRLEDCPLDRVGLLVDHYRPRLGLEPGNLAEILDLPLIGALPASGGTARLQAMNTGEPMFALTPKDPFCAASRELARTLLAGGEAMQAGNSGLLGRIFG